MNYRIGCLTCLHYLGIKLDATVLKSNTDEFQCMQVMEILGYRP